MNYMHRNLVTLFAVLLFALFATPSRAQDSSSFAPLQSAHAGNWFDPATGGTGFDVQTYTANDGSSGAFVTYYAGASPGSFPAWFAASVPWHGSTREASLYVSPAPFGGASAGEPIEVGKVKFTVDGSETCSGLKADVTFTAAPYAGTVQHFDLVPLIQPLAASCAASCKSVDFGPVPYACDNN